MQIVIRQLEGQVAIIEDKLHQWSLMDEEEFGLRGLRETRKENQKYLHSLNKSLDLLKRHQGPKCPKCGKH